MTKPGPKPRPFEDFYTLDDFGCWLWNGTLTKGGYAPASRRWGGSPHRWAYREFVGPLPVELDYRHGPGCPRHCVNPFHARPPGTRSQNNRDRVADGTHQEARKTHCPRGHEYPEASTPGIKRKCKTCHRDRERRSWRLKHWGHE